MRRAGSSTTIDGQAHEQVDVRVYNTGSISRDHEGHEHTLALSRDGCTLFITPQMLRSVLEWYEAGDEQANERQK